MERKQITGTDKILKKDEEILTTNPKEDSFFMELFKNYIRNLTGEKLLKHIGATVGVILGLIMVFDMVIVTDEEKAEKQRIEQENMEFFRELGSELKDSYDTTVEAAKEAYIASKDSTKTE